MAIDNFSVIVMSGVEDGNIHHFGADDDNSTRGDSWRITIGRREDNDLCLKRDTYVSRNHAVLYWREKHWYLEDKDSTNGTFIENPNDFFNDERVFNIVPLKKDQLFRVGRTWLRIEMD